MLAAAAFAGAAQAQDPGALNGFRLPPAPSPTSAPVEGPVDAEHPVATPTTPVQQQPPRITLPDVTTPERERVRPPAAERRFEPVAIPEPTSIAPEPEEATEPAPEAVTSAAPAPISTEAPQPARPDDGWGWWLPALLGLAGLLTIGLFFWWLSRPYKRPKPAAFAEPEPARRTEPEPSAPAALTPIARQGPRRFLDPPAEPVTPPAAEPAAVPQPAPQPAPQAAATPEPKPRPAPVQIPRPAPQPVAAPPPPPPSAPTPAAAGEPAPRPATTAHPLFLSFTPRSLQISLVYATLAYQLDLSNRGEAPLTALRIFGDMISAHASQSSGQQLSLAHSAIEKKHEVASLAPGETATLKGQILLPLSEVLPVRAGKAELFVPLARFLVEATGSPDLSRIYSLGQRADRTDGSMSPFRIDLGPQLFREILHREVDVARWLQRKAG